MIDNDKIFILFANCIPVDGFKRSVICDLQVQKYRYIPNIVFEILTEHCEKNIRQIKTIYLNEHNSEIDEYFGVLIEEGFGFLSDKSKQTNFPRLNMEWNSSELINNAIVDVSDVSRHNYHKIITELNSLSCKHLEIRFFNEIDIDEIDKILFHTENTAFRSIHLIIKYHSQLTNEKLHNLIRKYGRVLDVIIHSSPEDETFPNERKYQNIKYSKTIITDQNCCGKISVNNFHVNMDSFTESLAFNSCLNKKISIDEYGEIKNCPSMKKSFGSINNTSLNNALEHIEFKRYWAITKDQIEVCKACEYRYICSDCRAHIQDKNNINSKPINCKYNPYEATWN